MANNTIIMDAFEMFSNNGGMEEEAERIYMISGIRTLVAILQPGESEFLYIHMSKYVCTLCMYNNTYSLGRFLFIYSSQS